MTSARAFWDKAAPKYANASIRDMAAYTRTLERTRSHLAPTDHVLEVGCGTGGTARALADHLAHVTGTDISPEMIRIARQRTRDEGVPNALFEVADIADSPSGPFDVVLAHNLLHLLPDIEQGIADLHSRLRPGGLFISKTVCLGQPGLTWKIRAVLKLLPVLQWLGKAPSLHLLSHAQLEAMITGAGFDLLETVTDPAISRYVVARRA